MPSTSRATVLKLREEVAQCGLVLRERLVEQLLPVEVEGAGVMAALRDVQADHDRKACVHDAVLPWSIIDGRATKLYPAERPDPRAIVGAHKVTGTGVGVDSLRSTEYTQIRKGATA